MTEPLRDDLTVWRGDTFDQPFTVLNVHGSAAEDLTGWTIRIRVEDRTTGSEVFDLAPTPATPANGTVNFELTVAQTRTLILGHRYTYQVQTTDPDGEVATQFYGYLIVTGNMPA